MTKTSFEFLNNVAGHNEKIKTIEKMEALGWKIEREDIIPSSFNPCTGVILLIICFPLVLFGLNKSKIIVTFTKD